MNKGIESHKSNGDISLIESQSHNLCIDDFVSKVVEVYKNLNNGKISVRAIVNGKKKVIGYCDSIFLKNVEFKVSESGRQRVLLTKQKNVHAFLKGELICFNSGKLSGNHFSYNPYTFSFFYSLDNKIPIHHALFVFVSFNNGNVFLNN